jgi:hypothetical protein
MFPQTMSARAKLSPAKVADFLLAALAPENPSQAPLLALVGSKGSPPAPAPAPVVPAVEAKVGRCRLPPSNSSRKHLDVSA